MSSTDEARLELMRQLKMASQLQNSWINQVWNGSTDFHPAGGMLLSDLAKHGETRPSELAKRRMVDTSVISRQIAQLAAAGLIERRPAPEDGRASLIRVSEKGERELARWRSLYLGFMTTALGDWDEERLTGLTGRLAEMNDDLRAALGPQVALEVAP
jgi:DNA-binding MarR family transcriptional regulator